MPAESEPEVHPASFIPGNTHQPFLRSGSTAEGRQDPEQDGLVLRSTLVVAAGLQLGFFIETSSAILRCPGEEMVSPLVLTARGEAVFQGGHVVSVFLCPVGVLLLPQGISLKIWGSNGDVKPLETEPRKDPGWLLRKECVFLVFGTWGGCRLLRGSRCTD